MQRLKNLRSLRERKALTQQQVADGAGISVGSYRCLECLENGPRPATARKLADFFCVEPYELWEEKRQHQPQVVIHPETLDALDKAMADGLGPQLMGNRLG